MRTGVELARSIRTIESLLPIWQRVLGLSEIHEDDNFFDLGGDPALATRLFDEIARACGRELPALTIYQAPTIRSMSALLDLPGRSRFPPLVELRSGTETPPIFVTHGLGGSVMELFDVIRLIETRHAIYGMQAKGSDGLDEPLVRIEDMAQFFLDEVLRIEPRGPYFLLGYSLGGLVVLEMARSLLERGRPMGLLVMIDSYPPKHPLSLSKRLVLSFRRSKRFKPSAFDTSLSQAPGLCERNAGKPPAVNGMFARVAERLRRSSYLALERYRPHFYDGHVKFVRAEITTEFPVDPGVVWANQARGFEVETVPGDHHGMLTEHARSLAKVLSRYVKSVSRIR